MLCLLCAYFAACAGGAPGVGSDSDDDGLAGGAGGFAAGGTAGEGSGGSGGESVPGGQGGGQEQPGGQAGSTPIGVGGSAGTGGANPGGQGGVLVPVRPPEGAGAVASAACGQGKPSPDGQHKIVVNGKERTFLIRVPKAYDGKYLYRAIFVFHGAGETSDSFDRGLWFRLDIGENAVLILPDALSTDPKNAAKTSWIRDPDDDIEFFDAALAYAKTRACFDTTRVFATGHSSGGYFTNTLGCQRGDVLRGIAPVAGGMRDIVNCKGNVAAWVAHGDKDTNVSPTSGGGAARDFWVNRNGCSKSNPTNLNDANRCVAYSGCQDGMPVQWCLYDGNHFWPRSANKGLWEFFAKL